MRNIRFAFILVLAYAVMGCGTWGSGFVDGGFWRQDCSEYQQVTTNMKADLTIYKEMVAKGEITQDELISIDQDAANYSSRMKDLCGFMISGKMKIQEYLTEADNAHARYLSARRLVFESQNKTRKSKSTEK